MIIKIGTRHSLLALWQAEKVACLLQEKGFDTEIVKIKSDGDKDLINPLYKMNIQGVFTKALDMALLNKKIDIAVHSYKDIPTILAAKLKVIAVMPRDAVNDILIYKTDPCTWPTNACIASSSLRRRAQWLYKFPSHTFTDVRGNIHTRLQKLDTNDWQAMILSCAGLKRMGMELKNTKILSWMIPAPAQGCIAIVGKENDEKIQQACLSLNDTHTALCTHVERLFLKSLLGGCSLPIGALATIANDTVFFKGNVTTPDGKLSFDVEIDKPIHQAIEIGVLAAQEILKQQPHIIQKIQYLKNG
ncbi:MAG: hydroxymethylbilane synthase [Chitinophagaceae bacterium]